MKKITIYISDGCYKILQDKKQQGMNMNKTIENAVLNYEEKTLETMFNSLQEQIKNLENRPPIYIPLQGGNSNDLLKTKESTKPKIDKKYFLNNCKRFSEQERSILEEIFNNLNEKQILELLERWLIFEKNLMKKDIFRIVPMVCDGEEAKTPYDESTTFNWIFMFLNSMSDSKYKISPLIHSQCEHLNSVFKASMDPFSEKQNYIDLRNKELQSKYTKEDYVNDIKNLEEYLKQFN